MARKLFGILGLAFIIGAFLATPSQAATLWYNGDMDNYNALINAINNTNGNAGFIYDNFVVGNSGWAVDSIWSNNVFSGFQSLNSAYWEIRSGVSEGNGGTLLFNGTSSASVTPTGRTLWDQYTEYTVLVSGLGITLDPGTYWLTVVPIGEAELYEEFGSFITTTSGDNAVGSPAGNDGNAYFYIDDAFFFTSTTSGEIVEGEEGDPYLHDFSMGVGGRLLQLQPVPEPATLSLLGLGLLPLLKRRKK